MKRFVFAALFVLVPMLAQAQVLASRPQNVEFIASPDHNVTYVDGAGQTQSILSRYRVRVYEGTSASGTQVINKDIGKGTPNAQSVIVASIKPEIDAINPGQYFVTVSAEGPGGVSAAIGTPFSWPIPVPSAPQPPVRVTP